MPILHFRMPAYARGLLVFALARKDSLNRNQYMLVLAEPYGMADDRRVATLNCSTSANEADAPASSPSEHPVIWFDCDVDRDPLVTEPKGGVYNAMLQADPPVIRPTGRTRKMVAEPGGVQVAHEVEILPGEDELSHMCCYCGQSELLGPTRFKRCDRDTARPQYWCSTCEHQSTLTRLFSWAVRRYWLGGLE
ncbi:uncharacterized protein B0H18DRAFT_1125869 [Fomitopsis serialis]|uniref:uncharacterized protein n=1 Tax=Fomitopsis serialis TaxID=139415 RepID=UPI0020072096|nr:uncharacterized protein B0H18DRAFT_1125869 [Neoantrodia serialis]KAH9914006.1 hypothetical protein B0H18DRAFT_1125869 [Neoantrodia serialis]